MKSLVQSINEGVRTLSIKLDDVWSKELNDILIICDLHEKVITKRSVIDSYNIGKINSDFLNVVSSNRELNYKQREEIINIYLSAIDSSRDFNYKNIFEFYNLNKWILNYMMEINKIRLILGYRAVLTDKSLELIEKLNQSQVEEINKLKNVDYDSINKKIYLK